MPKPKVIETLGMFRRDVMQKEKDMMLLMTRRWSGVEKALTPQIEALSREIESLRLAGKDVTPGKLYRMARYKALLAQVRNESAKYEGWAGRQIEQGQRDYFEMGNAAARSMLKDLLPPGVNVDFNRLPVDAANNMIGLCKDGSPLFDVLKKRALFPEAVDGMTTQLINAMALGWNPRKTARAMADGLAAGLNKALVIARTEQLRAYREATFQNYNANQDIVNGWIWHSACDDRTCAACWSMHGTVHALDERLDDHVCGRCAMIPQTKSWAELGYSGIKDTNPVIPSGEEEFAKLSEAKQQTILGPGRFELYRTGELDFKGMATFTDDPVWGRSIRIMPLGNMRTNINANIIIADEIIKVDPFRVDPINPITNIDKYKALSLSMRENGWQGDEILAFKNGERLQAITGSHRIYAARDAEIDVIVDFIDVSKFTESQLADLIDLNDDEDRLVFFEKLNKKGVISDRQLEIMQRELKNNAMDDIRSYKEQASKYDELKAIENNKKLAEIATEKEKKRLESEARKIKQEIGEERKMYNAFLKKMQDKYENMYQDMTDAELEELEKLERELYK